MLQRRHPALLAKKAPILNSPFVKAPLVKAPRARASLAGASLAAASIAALLAAPSLVPASRAAGTADCTPLRAVGGGTSVSKEIQLNGPLTFPFGRTNFNTDFTVTSPYSSYRIHFVSTSKKEGPYPIQAYLKFSDGSNLQVVNETLVAQPGQAKDYGPFSPPAGKLVTQVNVKVGSSYNANATGMGYTISVSGCP
jgi:hypothetical protein